MSDEGRRSIRQSVLGADKGLRVIDGGGSTVGGGSDDPAEPQCPVTPLGHLDGVAYFLDVRGQKRTATARQLGSRQDLLFLFGGDEAWLRHTFPKRVEVKSTDANGAETTVWRTVDFKINEAAAALIRGCFQAGLFGDHIALRKPGVWLDAHGDIAVHCGDQVLIGNDWCPAGERTGNQIWAAAAPTPRPGVPCGAHIGQELQDRLSALWNWREVGSPIAVTGLIANAYYGAATAWRPAGFVTGATGSGKTALLRVIRAALPLHHFDNDARKAGIEQAIDGRAMAIIIDEASDRANRHAARDLADLLLSVSSDEGTKGSRGTPDGRGRRVELCGLIIFFSINPPDLEPQHFGRLTLIDLVKPESGADQRNAHRDAMQFARAHGAQLWGRMLAGWDRYNLALERFREGLGKVGCAPREMDQAGALLAGWWTLVREGLPDERGVREGIAALDGFIRPASEVDADDRPQLMLQHLLSSMITLHRTTDREPFGKLVAIAFGEFGQERSPYDARELLTHCGVRIVEACAHVGEPPPPGGCTCRSCRDNRGRPVPRMSDKAGLWFSTQNPELRKLFSGTPFEGDRWRYEMLRLHTAQKSGRSVRIGEVSGYALWLAYEELREPDVTEP